MEEDEKAEDFFKFALSWMTVLALEAKLNEAAVSSAHEALGLTQRTKATQILPTTITTGWLYPCGRYGSGYCGTA